MAANGDVIVLGGLAVSTHSHPKVAAVLYRDFAHNIPVSTHSHPKVAADCKDLQKHRRSKFQHTATRRWLHQFRLLLLSMQTVSTHSHPKVAASGVDSYDVIK